MNDYERLLRQDSRNESRIFWCEIGIVLFVGALVVAYVIIT